MTDGFNDILFFFSWCNDLKIADSNDSLRSKIGYANEKKKTNKQIKFVNDIAKRTNLHATLYFTGFGLIFSNPCHGLHTYERHLSSSGLNEKNYYRERYEDYTELE